MICRIRPLIPLVVLMGLLLYPAPPPHAEDTASDRESRTRMVEVIDTLARQTYSQKSKVGISDRVLDALRVVPRHEFVSDKLRASAYDNRPLPIGYGQTISQPYIVGLMTDLLRPEPGHRVFELGTGSGYQAAVLAELGLEVFTVEIVPELGHLARQQLRRSGYERVRVAIGDGYYGWPEKAPFDRIVVTAASSHVPPPLVEQLKPGGLMVIPVGPPFLVQQLVVVTKGEDGSVRARKSVV